MPATPPPPRAPVSSSCVIEDSRAHSLSSTTGHRHRAHTNTHAPGIESEGGGDTRSEHVVWIRESRVGCARKRERGERSPAERTRAAQHVLTRHCYSLSLLPLPVAA